MLVTKEVDMGTYQETLLEIQDEVKVCHGIIIAAVVAAVVAVVAVEIKGADFYRLPGGFHTLL